MPLAAESPRAARRSPGAWLLGVVVAVLGCQGEIQSVAGPRAVDGAGRTVRSCAETQADLTPIRLLTRDEYNHTVRDLFGIAEPLLVDSPAADTGTFDNDAAALSISSPMAQHYLEVGERVAAAFMANPGSALPCDVASGDEACARTFITTMGRRAFRRPVPAAEVDALLALYAAGREAGTFREAMELVVQGMVSSPRFLYHLEVGVPAEGGLHALDDHELASKLSYFLWNTAPDAELDAAADARALHTPEQIRAQAERMLASPRMRETSADLHAQWLDLRQVYAVTKDLSQFREFTEEVRADLVGETQAFVEEVVWNDGGSVADLFSAAFTMVNARLGDFYGLKGATDETFVRVETDPRERAGLATLGSLMAIHGKIDRTAPVHRGIFVRHELLCEELPPAPENVPALEVIDPGLPVRERLRMHREKAECAACHRYMDPIGFLFENFDTVGRFRTVDEKGNPIDASGEWVDLSGAEEPRPYTSAAAFAADLATDPRAARCVSEQWYRYAMGRTNGVHDECTLDVLEAAATAGSVRDMVLTITGQDVFRFREAPAGLGRCE